GSNSAVVPRGYARWVPLIDAKDADNRQRGAVGAIAFHYDGPYAGSAWGFFGVSNRDLFAPGDPEGERLLLNTVEALLRRAFLHGLRTDWACYRQGEAVGASVTVRNAGRRSLKLRVRFVMEGGPPLKEVEVGEVPPGQSRQVRATWPAFHFQSDLYRVSATLLADTVPLDRMESGFVVWTPAVVLSGPRVDLKENFFRVNGRPAFLCGTNQTGMIFASSFENPLVWDRDLAQMRDYGVNVMRVLHFSPFAKGAFPQGPWSPADLRQRPEALVRQADALVQLCQKHGIALFLSLHDWMEVGLSDAELELQRDWARFWAARYRDVPGILYDVQNEPTVHTPDTPDLRRAWNAFLKGRYGTDAVWRAAWGSVAPNAPLGEVPLSAPASEWSSLAARDYAEFRVEVLNRWVRANVQGVREGDPDALCTVGFLQTLANADKLLGVRYTDFSNMHSYLPPADLPKNLKYIDRRFEGKSFSLGEFGAKCHPAWQPSAFVGVTEAQAGDYFLR
ncbi:MAG: beta-galactosidase, partial [Armatimonadota bacterium]|nr:beta-galactosidase [Armatimonadota bacterium]